jgi:hypothetical protein
VRTTPPTRDRAWVDAVARGGDREGDSGTDYGGAEGKGEGVYRAWGPLIVSMLGSSKLGLCPNNSVYGQKFSELHN